MIFDQNAFVGLSSNILNFVYHLLTKVNEINISSLMLSEYSDQFILDVWVINIM